MISFSERDMQDAGRLRLFIWSENLFLAATGLYLLLLTLNTTYLEFNSILPEKMDYLMLYSLSGLIALKLFFLPEERRRISDNRFLLAATAVSGLWFLVYMTDGYRFLWFIAILTLGCFGTDYRKVLKVYVCSVGIVIAVSVLATTGGGVKNLVYFQGERLRSSWGINYPTDFASFFLFLSLAAWVAWNNIPDLVFLPLGLVSLLAAYSIARSNTSSLCIGLFLVCVCWHAVTGMFPPEGKLRRWGDKLEQALCWTLPVLTVAMILLMFAFSAEQPWAQVVDTWSHHRLRFAAARYKLTGIHLFGVPFSQLGAGGYTILPMEYNFIDCSYLLILLRYGAVILLTICILWVVTAKTGIKKGYRRLALAMTVIAVHALSEHHFTELRYNIILALPFAVLSTENATICERRALKEWKTELTAMLLAVLPVTGMMLLIKKPALFAFRTLCSVTNVTETAPQRLLLFVGCSVIILMVILLTAYLYCLWRDIITGTRPKRLKILIPLLCAMLVIPVIIKGSQRIDRAMEENRQILTEESDIIELIQSVDDVDLYVNDLPALYEKAFGNIAFSIYQGEDLARKENIALLTDVSLDSRALFKRGFLYTELSDRHGLYTDSQELANRLIDEGINPAGYYARKKTVNLAELGEQNQLASTEAGGLLLSTAEPLAKGPGLDLYDGKYELSFSLRLLDHSTSFQDYPVCTLQIVGRFGTENLFEKTLKKKDFDLNGNLTFAIEQYINSAGVEFRILPENSFLLELDEISIRKNAENWENQTTD